VKDQLLEADVVAHLKKILSADDAVTELLYNCLMLVKAMSTMGWFFTSDVVAFLHWLSFLYQPSSSRTMLNAPYQVQ